MSAARCASEYMFGYYLIKCLRAAGHVGQHSGRCSGGPLKWDTASADQAMADFLNR